MKTEFSLGVSGYEIYQIQFDVLIKILFIIIPE